MSFEACACTGKTLARLLQPAVMALLAHEPLHGYLLAQRLQELAMFRDHPPDPTGLYRLLKSMEDRGLVKSTWDLAERGPAKRQYKLTRSGRACLRKWSKTLADYSQSLTEILAIIQATEK
jgi:DNA-binding PadR family transcriptional regulator